MDFYNPVVLAALIAGLFGVIGSLISFVLLMIQSKATNKLERELRQYESNLQFGSEVHLRLYERAMEEISKYHSLLKDVHLKLTDYKNGVLHEGITPNIEKNNTRRFYDAWNELRFPGIYVPTDIAEELDAIRREYENIKWKLYEIAKQGDKDSRRNQLNEFNDVIEKMEIRSSTLIRNWKSRLLSNENILAVILGSDN